MKRFPDFARSPIVISAAAIFTRLAVSIFILTRVYHPQLLFSRNEPSHIAACLVSGFGYCSPYANTPLTPTAQQPPIYPLILAGVFKLFGSYTTESAWVIVGLHILAAGLTTLLIFRLGELYFGRSVAVVASWLWVLPWGFEVSAFALSLTNAYFAALGFCGLLIWIPKVAEKNRGWFAMGVYAGVFLLLQPAFLPVFALYGVCLGLSRFRSRQMWLAIAGLILTLAPWTARNYFVLHRFVPFRDNFGLELWVGNRPGMKGTRDYTVDFPGNDPTNYVRLGETRFMDAKLSEAAHFIAEDPRSFLNRSSRRVLEFWYEPYRPGMILFFGLSWVGAAFIWNKRFGWLFVIPLIVFPLVYYVTHMYAGYRRPIDPVIIVLVAYLFVHQSARAYAAVRRALSDEGRSRQTASRRG